MAASSAYLRGVPAENVGAWTVTERVRAAMISGIGRGRVC